MTKFRNEYGQFVIYKFFPIEKSLILSIKGKYKSDQILNEIF